MKFQLKFACLLWNKRLSPWVYETEDKEEIVILEKTKFISVINEEDSEVGLLDEDLDLGKDKGSEDLENEDWEDDVVDDEDDFEDDSTNSDDEDWELEEISEADLRLQYFEKFWKEAPLNIKIETLISKLK